MQATTVEAPSLDLSAEDFFPLNDAPKFVPGRPSRACVWRWTSEGIIRGGGRVRLKYLNSGARRYTTKAWISEFLAAMNADNPTQHLAPTMTPARRQQQARAAMAALKQRGAR